jgi:hypothetical protein
MSGGTNRLYGPTGAKALDRLLTFFERSSRTGLVMDSDMMVGESRAARHVLLPSARSFIDSNIDDIAARPRGRLFFLNDPSRG